jgi:Mrp family chromosome partitioning ATPase/capsular polysaccharide biosynthesis protein
MTGPSFATPVLPAAPKHAAHSSRPAKPGEKPDEAGGVRVLTYLRLHWLMILFCGSLLSTAGAFAAWELLASKYESEALLQVSSVPQAIAHTNPNQARTDFSTYVKTTAQLLKSDFVLNAALRDLKDVPTIKAQAEPIKYLKEELVVTWQDGSEVVRITFKGHQPQDAKRIVDAVQKAFMAEVIQKDVDEKKAFLQKVENERLNMQQFLTTNYGTKKPAADAAGEVVPAGGPAAGVGAGAGAGAGVAPGILPGVGVAPAAAALPVMHYELLSKLSPATLIGLWVQLRAKVEELPPLILDAERRAKVLAAKLQALKDAPVPQAAQDAVERDPDVANELYQLRAARYQYEKISSASKNPDHTPAILDLKANVERHEAEYTRVRQQKLDSLKEMNKTPEAKGIAGDFDKVIQTMQLYQEQLEHAQKRLEQVEKLLPDLPTATGAGGVAGLKEGQAYTPEIGALQITDGIHRRLIDQYYMTKLELNSPPRVRILQPGSNPTQNDTKKQILGTSFAGVMGFVVMAMGAIGFETLARRVSALADVRAATSVPVVGVVPCPPGGVIERDPVKRAAANEAIDKLRAYVAQTWLSRGATSIIVTSPTREEGKALTSFGLASSLAQAGYKTLLVDFDLREPALHAFAGVPNLVGTCELLRGETDTRTAIQFLPSGLHLLPAGKWSDEARKAATGERLDSVLAKLKEPYDCVVLHGHAILTVAESVELARRCEVVLVCARYRETSCPLLKRATERVATMEVPYTGVVYVGATEQEALC